MGVTYHEQDVGASVLDIEAMKEVFRREIGVDPKVWACPCLECPFRVVYARAVDDEGECVLFACSGTYSTSANTMYPTLSIENAEDFQVLLAADEDIICRRDRQLYQKYLSAGLKEALLAA